VQARTLAAIALVGGAAVYVATHRGQTNSASRRDAPRVADAPAEAIPQGDVVVASPQRDSAPERDLAMVQERIREGAPGTYILHMLPEQGDTLARWPDRLNEPLRVWIQPDASFEDWDASYAVVAERAFEEWREAGFPLQFDRVPDSTGADIKIVFVHQMPLDEEMRRIGVARRIRDEDGWLVHAEIMIATHARSGEVLPAETVGGTARHEVGHVLGLGHSPSPADVMYPESRTAVISASDRATLHLIYMLPPGPVK
jgi:hypothetical protein